ncbi:hypothetical protein DIURU_004217 [Diutina rugosa]|uniref:Uncharacterized protein n=1 Tax=Diutina rugosa TaxID=5481 RepID=A0A642UPY3_DIURU|nr:uncharacterized protein DIURU_004217 [Diutina rugosa]KAA8899550.1 hypothetical protein DIURU_004217 [Diutina rugosa]
MSGAIREAWNDLRDSYYQQHPEIGVVVSKPQTTTQDKDADNATTTTFTGNPSSSTGNDKVMPPTAINDDEVVGTIDNSELLQFLDGVEDGDKFKQEVKRVAMEWYWRGFYHGFAEGKSNSTQ